HIPAGSTADPAPVDATRAKLRLSLGLGDHRLLGHSTTPLSIERCIHGTPSTQSLRRTERHAETCQELHRFLSLIVHRHYIDNHPPELTEPIAIDLVKDQLVPDTVRVVAATVK